MHLIDYDKKMNGSFTEIFFFFLYAFSNLFTQSRSRILSKCQYEKRGKENRLRLLPTDKKDLHL